MTPENVQNHGASVQNVEAPEPCDHVIGFCYTEQPGAWLANQSDDPEDCENDGTGIDRFRYCPRCGAKLPEG